MSFNNQQELIEQQNTKQFEPYSIYKALDIGRKGRGGYIWLPCNICNKCRFVDVVDFKRNKCENGRCRKCQQKEAASIMQKKNWNGGETISNGYCYIHKNKNEFNPNFFGKNVYEKRCRLIMSKHLNRPLLSNEHIHHINGDKLDDNLLNLELLGNKEHSKGNSIAYKKGYNQALKDLENKIGSEKLLELWKNY
jgi:hypothetical protein